MRRGQRRARKARQEAAPRVFRVESAQPYGWIVYLEGFAETNLPFWRVPEIPSARTSSSSTRRQTGRSSLRTS